MFQPLETFHWVKTQSFQFAAVDTSGRVRRGATDDSMNSELGRKRFLGAALSHWDNPILGKLHKKPRFFTCTLLYRGFLQVFPLISPGMFWIQRISMVVASNPYFSIWVLYHLALVIVSS